MITIESLVVELGCDKLQQGRHRTAVMGNGGVVHLPLVLQLSVILECQPAVLFADKGTLASGNGIHRRYAPQGEVTAMCLV